MQFNEGALHPQPWRAGAPICGNGVVEGSEECDDANAQNADGCLTTCQTPVNWVPSDVHAHSTGCGHYTSPEDLVRRLKAQGLRVGAALVWGEGYADDALFFTGRDHPASGSDFILHYDMEVSHFAAARTGHLILLGLDSLRFSSDVVNTPSSGIPVIEWARRQPRAVVGMAHGQYWPADGSFPLPPGGCCVPWDVVVNAAQGAPRLPCHGAGTWAGARGRRHVPSVESDAERRLPGGDRGG